MDTFDRLFEAFWTYAGPFLLLWWSYDWARRRPRTRKTVLWAVFAAAFGLYGIVNLGRLVVNAVQ
jgi:hypothetical protein